MTVGATGQRVTMNGQNFLAQYDKDRRSVFVGNLPLSMTADTLRHMVSGCGQVVEIQMFNKPVPGGNGEYRSLSVLWGEY